MMPRKKPPTIDEIVDDYLLDESSAVPNGHDAEGFEDAELSGALDEPIEKPSARRKRAAQAVAETDAEENNAEPSDGDGEPAPARGRSRRKRVPKDGEPEILKLPLVPLRDMVVFPHMVTSLFVGRKRSLKAIDAALNGDRVLVAVSQRNPEDEDVEPDDLYDIGVELVIGRSLKMPDGTSSLLVQGQRRVRVLRYLRSRPYIKVLAEAVEEPTEKTQSTEALMRAVLALFEKVVSLSHNLSNDSYVAAMNVDEPGWLADLIASSMPLDQERRHQILDTTDPVERLQVLSVMLAKELDMLDLENRIHSRVQNEVDK